MVDNQADLDLDNLGDHKHLVILGLIYECEVYKIKKMVATILLAIAFVYGLYGFFNIFTT